MRVALCLSGQMRTYDQCYDNLKTFILDKLNPDVFVHTWARHGKSSKVSENHTDTFVDIQHINNLYHPLRLTVDKFPENGSDKYKNVTVPDELKKEEPLHYQGSIPMFYKIWSCNQMTKEVDRKYDCVIKLRPDLNINEPIPDYVLNNLDTLWFPDKDVDLQCMVSDRFAIGSVEIMDYYCSVWKRLNEYWRNPVGDVWEKNRVGERLMYHHMNNSDFDWRSFSVDYDLIRKLSE